MTTQQYQNLTPREASPSASSRLFSFARIRSGAATRFYPGDGAKLHYANRDVDTLEIPGVPSGYLAAGDSVTAHYKGVCVFRGDVATIVEAKGRGTDATQTVTCVGPWSKMQRLVYRQLWTVSNGTAYSSRLILNQTRTGAAQTLNSELSEIARHGATACGYAVGAINVSSQVLPSDECRDITVADAIKRELRLYPKAVVRFDYSTTPPTLVIEKQQRASGILDLPGKENRDIEYNTHPITGVDLEIDTTTEVQGVSYLQINHQTAGNTSAGNPDCLYATLQINGGSANTVTQSFKSITENFPTSLNNAEWWKSKHHRLANVALASIISIKEGRRFPTKYPRITAATAGELEEAGLHCEVSTCTCKVTIETTDHKEEDIFLTANFLTTDAEGTAEDPKIYRWTAESSGESGESVPAGLASAILAERSGSIVRESMTVRLADSLPTVGLTITDDGQTLSLQTVDVDCGNLTADLTFGVPEYLAPEDMAALLSNFRNKCTTYSSASRKSGKPEDKGSDVEMGGIPPLSSTEFSPGTIAHLKIKTSDTGYGSIDLDSADLNAGEEMSVQEIVVGKDSQGADKTVKILATESFTPGGGFGLPISGNAPTAIGSNQMVTAHRYYGSEHQLQVKVRGLNITTTGSGASATQTITSLTMESDWIVVEGGQAVEHISHDYD